MQWSCTTRNIYLLLVHCDERWFWAQNNRSLADNGKIQLEDVYQLKAKDFEKMGFGDKVGKS